MDKVLDNELKLLFDKFSYEANSILGENLELIVIYGSVVLGDFRRGKGDIDFLCITKNNLMDEEIRNIQKLHHDIRVGYLGQLGMQLEGAYYTSPMVRNFKENLGRGYYLGTNETRWREVSSVNSLNFIDILMILRNGLVIFGEGKTADYFQEPTMNDIKYEFIKKLEDNIELSKQLEDIYFSIEMIYFATRGLNTILTGELVSKGKACEWFVSEYPKSKWVNLVEYTAKFRYPLSKEEEIIIDRSFVMESTTEFLNDMYNIAINKN